MCFVEYTQGFYGSYRMSSFSRRKNTSIFYSETDQKYAIWFIC